jgi:hypothetical protein
MRRLSRITSWQDHSHRRRQTFGGRKLARGQTHPVATVEAIMSEAPRGGDPRDAFNAPGAPGTSDTRHVREHAARFADVRRLLRGERTGEVLTAIAGLAARVSEPSEDSLDGWREIAPWTLAGLAREAIAQCRRTATSSFDEKKFRALLNTYSQSYDPHLDVGSDEHRFTLLTSHAYDQMPYQESDGQELSRTLALFADEIPANRSRLAVVDTASVEELVGAPLDEAIRGTFLLAECAFHDGGVLPDRVWDEPWVRDFRGIVSAGTLQQVATRMTADVVALRASYRNTLKQQPVPDYLRRFAYNPLTSTPLVHTGHRLISPQPRLIRRRMAPAALFYAGTAKYGNAFGKDLGYLAESYIGRTLAQIEGAQLIGEVTYREKGAEKKSIDWFLILPNLVVLIESKATRPDLRLRLGNPHLGRALHEQLTKSVKQLNTTNDLIAAAHNAFAHIPTHRPRVGLVITAEPFYLGNESRFRKLLPTPNLPASFGSLRDLEALCGYPAAVLEQGLKRATADPELSGWSPLKAVKEATGVNPNLPTPVQGALTDRLGLDPPTT